ncbi:MAG: hypothetical protein QNJ46_00075 [Leptolyngbyaceae cyanobacterium MO_188.B28]|nr:hypothetical protein [Leptolyngbyaceae cyanobacterium MO_188.B28]
MSRIQTQAAKFWQTLNAPETFSSYKSAVSVTWNILRELLLLLWLCLLWITVLGERAIALGSSTRAWLSSQKEASANRSTADMGKALQSALKQGLVSTVSQAKQQLGIPVVETEIAVSAAKSTSTSPAATANATPPANSVAQSKEPAEVS